jgi:hypothetical protein
MRLDELTRGAMSAQRNAGGRLRLMFLTEGFLPDSGGVATSTLRIAEHLARRDVATTVLTYLRCKSTDLNSPPGFEHVNGADVIRLGPFFKTSGTDQNIALNEKHKAVLRRRFVDNAVALIRQMDLRPNLIYTMYLMNSGFLATYIAAILQISHIAGVRGNDIGRNLFDTRFFSPPPLHFGARCSNCGSQPSSTVPHARGLSRYARKVTCDQQFHRTSREH